MSVLPLANKIIPVIHRKSFYFSTKWTSLIASTGQISWQQKQCME
jgi:hypothetical protein